MMLSDVAATSRAVGATRSRLAKRALLADALRAAGDDIEVVAGYLAGALRQRRTGIGWGALRTRPEPATRPCLTVAEVDAEFDVMAGLAGPGSQVERAGRLDTLLRRATDDEQAYLVSLLLGDVRQGALDGVLVDAIAAASEQPLAAVRRAHMVTGSLPLVAKVALTEGAAGLAAFSLQVGTALKPMLASSAKGVADGLLKADPSGAPVAVEAKLDGIRIQVHRDGDDVAVFTRSLDDITARVPGVVARAQALPARSFVLDGEALVLDTGGRPVLFQDSASAAATHALENTDQQALGLQPFFFDALAIDGDVLMDEPTSARHARLAALVPAESRVRRLVTDDPDRASAFADEVLAAGHEGVVVKNLDAPYAAGRRGSAWVKVKPVHTLDLVVLAVEWGSGRRAGLLSNIHLGARHGDGFVMLGKTFKGMTDQMLAWQTTRFHELETHRDEWTVYVRPEQVVEIAVDGVQRSTRYPGGVALRFARVVRYRDDKNAAEADSLEQVLALRR